MEGKFRSISMLDKLRLLLIDADRSKLGKDSKFDLDIFSEQRQSVLEL